MRIRWTTAAVDDLTGMCDYLTEQETPVLARARAASLGHASLSSPAIPTSSFTNCTQK
jgi:hypothetical protein